MMSFQTLMSVQRIYARTTGHALIRSTATNAPAPWATPASTANKVTPLLLYSLITGVYCQQGNSSITP